MEAVAAARAYRRAQKLSQAEFAERFGLPMQTYKQWERGARRPDKAAEILLRIIVAAPGLVEDVLRRG